MKNDILKHASLAVSKVGFQVKKHSPEIFLISGIIGLGVGTVMACKATTKLEAIMVKSKSDIDQIHNYIEEHGESEEYTKNDETKDLTIVYIQTGVKIVKLYGPAVAVSLLSLASILTSHNVLRKRNFALAAAYATIDRGFKEYRGRVVDKFGEAIDKELRYNIKAKEFEEVVIDDKGKEKTIKKTVDIVDTLNTYSEYSRFFDESCEAWEKNSEYNLMFLRAQQNYANDLLVSRGYLFLNEVYVMLGIPRTKAGQIVGWSYSDKTKGDRYVDFGIYEANRESSRGFVNGYERVILLDFNVDGPILDLMNDDTLKKVNYKAE